MKWTRTITQRIRSLFRRNAVERELEQELRFHLENQILENISAGMTPEEARHASTRAFGGVEQFKEQCRDERRVNLVETLFQDARHAIRMLGKNPGFVFFTVMILATGIAANTAIFSIADAVLLRPLPYRAANRLVMIWEDATSYGFPHDTPAPGNFADWKSRNQVFEDVAAASFGASFTLTGEGRPEEIMGRRVTTNLFSVLGVMPRGFQFPDREAQLWIPARFTKEDLANHGSHFLEVVARLKPDISLPTANVNLAAIAQKLAEEHPDTNAKVGAFAVPLREELAGDLRPAILVLLGAVCFVLLIACANVANLLL